MQLVAYGAQDIYLSGNPQITFWKVVYRRHTNFSMESIEQTFNGQVDFGRRITATISRNGDLITKVYFQVDLPQVLSATSTFAWTENIGNVMIDNVELDIGGQRIDKHYGDWMHIWNELTVSNNSKSVGARLRTAFRRQSCRPVYSPVVVGARPVHSAAREPAQPVAAQ